MTRDDAMRETIDHAQRVGRLLMQVMREIQDRALQHDRSKFEPEEFEAFMRLTPQLKDLTYDSEEYRTALDSIWPAMKHHYERNRHHPEHFLQTTDEMTLIDLIEMLADWKAASERHEDGDLRASIEKNAARFGYSNELKRRLYLTAVALEWTV